MNGFSINGIKYLLIVALFFSFVYMCFSPLIVSIDSIEGFLTYKQSLHSATLNFRPEVSPMNVNVDYLRFNGYWSPGQWLYPGALNYLLHLKLGVAAIIVTIVFAVSGMIGFYKVFRGFNFTPETCWYCLALIFCSYTFYYSLIVYQGGEILSFGVFPWFVYAALSAKQPSLKNLIIIAVLFFFCFLAKLTLLLYCPIIVACRILDPMKKSIFREQNSPPGKSQWLYMVPVLILCAVVYFAYLHNHPFPHDRFKPRPLKVFTPLGSPVASILSFHQIGDRLSLKVPGLSMTIVYFIFVALSLVLLYIIVRYRTINSSYRFLLAVLYTGISLSFIILYLFNLNQVDESPRHFKFLGFMFLPGILTVAGTYLTRLKLQIIVLLICLVSTAAFIYLKQDWTRGRFVSRNYFYRNYDNKDNVDQLDKESYKRLLVIAKEAPSSAIFFIQANLDIAMDLPFRCIIPWHNLDQKYFNHGPVIFACLPQDTLRRYPNLLIQKFPDYHSFQLLDQTKAFVYYKCQ
jgi:hypothetical protein